MLGILFALLALGVGLAVVRLLRLETWLAPGIGLAVLVVFTTWSTAARVPPVAAGGLLVGAGLAGALAARRTRPTRALAVVAAAVVLQAVLLALAFATVDVPVSPHDGAFHVEMVDSLRQGRSLQTWYPVGFHTSVAAVLALVPWVDSARGTFEVSEGLILLAPATLFGLARSLGMRPAAAAMAALVLALTYIYPYDNQLWGGWPLSTSLLLLMGVWSAAARWVQHPSPTRAALAGLLAGAVLLSHGTELYSAATGLLLLAFLRRRRLDWRRLVSHGSVALAIGAVCVAPYAAALVAWAHAGGATAAAAQALDGAASPDSTGGESPLEYLMSAFGAASLMDLPVRALLLTLGAFAPRARVTLVGWLTFTAVVLGAGLLHIGAIDWLYVLTFPWLVEHRPPQVAILFASVLIGAGLAHGWGRLRALRSRPRPQPLVWRRLAIASVLVTGFFAEGSAVTVYKTLAQTVAQWYSYTADDRAAMTWLRDHAQGTALLANNGALDAGIWAPYKADVAVLLPRSASGQVWQAREPIAVHIADLTASPTLETAACQLHVTYVYEGGREVPWDAPVLPDRSQLEGASDLQEVFRSGQAAVFSVRLPC